MADKAYSSAANRSWLRRRGIAAVIPVKERCFAKLKQFRAVATRYDKRSNFMYQGTVDVASIRIWLRDPVT
jgi:transposase